MAANKTTTEKTTTSTRETVNKYSKKRTNGRTTDDFPKAYMSLRTKLDGLEIMVLHYCLESRSGKERIERIKEIEQAIKGIIKKLDKKASIARPEGQCPDGFTLCNGCCVPYHCPQDYSS